VNKRLMLVFILLVLLATACTAANNVTPAIEADNAVAKDIVEEPNTAPLKPTLDNDSLVETAIQMLLITETYEAEQAGQTQTIEALLTQTVLAQTEAVADNPIPTNTIAPSATIPPITAGFYCVPINTQRDLAQVVRVIDGDTIEVIVNGSTQRVRYIGMDTPETGDPYFTEATNANAALVAGKTLTLVKDVSETDQYGRLLRYVFVNDNIFVNYSLVEEGYAQILTYPPDVACSEFFLEAQRSAKNASSGIWGLSFVSTEASPPVVQPTASYAPVAVCSCSGNIYNCGDFSTHNAAQTCYEYCISQGAGDIHRLDGDNDGSACESLP
jgi:micrococcal nuclease